MNLILMLEFPLVIAGIIWLLIAGVYWPVAIFVFLAFVNVTKIVLCLVEWFNLSVFGQKAPFTQTIVAVVSYLAYVGVFYTLSVYYYEGLALIPLAILIHSYALSISNGIYQSAKEMFGEGMITFSIALFGNSAQMATFRAANVLFVVSPLVTLGIIVYEIVKACS